MTTERCEKVWPDDYGSRRFAITYLMGQLCVWRAIMPPPGLGNDTQWPTSKVTVFAAGRLQAVR